MTALDPDFEKTLRRFVLDQLDEASRLELEGRLVQDHEAFEALGVIEDELTEEYLDGSLSEDERRRYERHSQSSADRRRSPDFFATLRARADRPDEEPVSGGWRLTNWLRPAPLPPAWLAAAAAALVLSLAANIWLAGRQDRPEAQLTRVETPTSRPEVIAGPVEATPLATAVTPQPLLASGTTASEALEAQLAEERQARIRAERRALELEQARPSPSTPTPTFVLAAGLLRSGGSLPRVSVEPDVDVVRLLLDLPGDDYPSYAAALSDADAEEIWSQSKLRAEEEPDRVVVPLLVSAALLSRGDYQVRLSGVTEGGESDRLATYTFRVISD